MAEERRNVILYLTAAADEFQGIPHGGPRKVLRSSVLIPEEPSRLLALRMYLRAHGSIEQHWAWTPEQTKEYIKKGDAVAVREAAARVRRNFEFIAARKNPPQHLTLEYVSKPRDLDTQLDLWN